MLVAHRRVAAGSKLIWAPRPRKAGRPSDAAQAPLGVHCHDSAGVCTTTPGRAFGGGPGVVEVAMGMTVHHRRTVVRDCDDVVDDDTLYAGTVVWLGTPVPQPAKNFARRTSRGKQC